MLEIIELTKHFGLNIALDNLSFKVEKGEILGFLGPNGAGKTTAMRILTGFLTPTGGTARIAGYDIQKQSLEARNQIGYLPESVPLYREMIVESYLHYVGALKGMNRRDRNKQVESILIKCGLEHVRTKIIGKLSKGYRQRVGLAQALIGDPQILIMDEPTEGLDPKQIIEIRHLIKALSGDKTVILSTHILPEVSMTCDRVIIINKGRLVAVDTPDNLNKTLQKGAVTIVETKAPRDGALQALKHINGVAGISVLNEMDSGSITMLRIESGSNDDLRSKIASVIVTNGWELLELRNERMTLEEIFIHLVTQEQEIAA